MEQQYKWFHLTQRPLRETLLRISAKMPLPDPMIRKDRDAFLILSPYTRYTVYIHSLYIIYALSAKDEYLTYTLCMHYSYTFHTQ